MNSVSSNTLERDYCINKAIPDGSNIYYATLFEQAKNKNIIIGLHAFLYELSDVISECSDPGIARVKLHWWQEEIERLFTEQPRHPITKHLKKIILPDHELKSAFNSIIESHEQFLFIEQMETLDNILTLYDLTAGEVWHQCSQQLQKPSAVSIKRFRDMGAIYHFIRCLQEPNTYITETRCIIPANIIKHQQLYSLRNDAQNKTIQQTEIFSPLLLELISRLNNIYNDLQEDDKAVNQHALILNRLTLKTCNEILNDGCRLLNTNTSLTPIRKLWIAWWTHFFS